MNFRLSDLSLFLFLPLLQVSPEARHPRAFIASEVISKLSEHQ